MSADMSADLSTLSANISARHAGRHIGSSAVMPDMLSFYVSIGKQDMRIIQLYISNGYGF
jgi:hypothetical protein